MEVLRGYVHLGRGSGPVIRCILQNTLISALSTMEAAVKNARGDGVRYNAAIHRKTYISLRNWDNNS
ncbi:hypothetical protein KIN20_024347 [Parelaphostrongylus tenuis]|uniref:Uncharacterized protein n=1 Tax=Parelaphostrongylus tenuis TaxID=148309 RepID=A0AAD5NCS1_PARTN|nr:hypothetical protein KIN20_024347 [Parelaphostrongylus tenuis]